MYGVSTISNQHKKSPSHHSDQKSKPSFFGPLIQPKLTINQPNDVYEQEADAVADKVMRMPATETNPPFFQPKPVPITPVQRKCASCKHEELLQREEEEEEQPVQLKSAKELDIQKKCAHCEEEEKLQMKAVSGDSAGLTAPPVVHDVINSGGQSLDIGTRGFMESRLGYDFSRVQIHDDALAHQSSKDINAHAYTHGSHIAFAAGQYQPNTDEGKRLLAHELTHVVQQSAQGAAPVVRRQMCRGILNAEEVWGVTRGVEVESAVRVDLIGQLGAQNIVWPLTIPGA